MFRETIFALSSGGLPSGVAVIRISGPHVRDTLASLVTSIPSPRVAVLRAMRGEDGTVLDHGLVIFFEGPNSFTGEDCAELHLHGGKAVVSAVLGWLGGREGLRQAEAGEFTRRAFLNGKLDLTAAEATADLVQAETEAQRRFALANAGGRQRALYEGWRARLLHARAMIEAELDFADEADVPGSVSGIVWSDLAALSQEIVNHVEGFRAAEIVREGFRVVLVGVPNAGKSSLLNALARRGVAIVTDVPGTTRDLVEVSLDLDGIKVIVTDTAGLRRSADPVEQIGIERALRAAEDADLVIELVDLGASDPSDAVTSVGGGQRLRVLSKSDLRGGRIEEEFDFAVSSVTGSGIPQLLRAIGDWAREASAGVGEIVPSRLRHVELLRGCAARIDQALDSKEIALEMGAEELRLAADSLGRITGAIDPEELLGAIFSAFCIGK